MFNQRELMKAMQRMGMNMSEIEAEEVIIVKKDGKQLKIKNPSVSKINIQGQSIFQISGIEEEINYSEEDIQMIIEQCNVSREEAIKALKETNGDLAEAILKLKKD
ncbi:MAG: nascent polypeptide-associated complex protein [Candidatus Woesearchaeota archaeon]